MRARHFAAPFVLLYWQLGPIPQPVTEPDGAVHWAVSGMASSGQWEDASFDCDGNLTSSEAVAFKDIGGRVDVETAGGFRFSASAGHVTQSRGDSSAGTAYEYSSMSYGGMIAWEGQHLGMGGGIVRDQDGENLPSVYLRVGRRDAAHFRTEVAPITETRMAAGVFRSGVGFKRGFAGLSFSPYFEKFSQVGVFGDFNVPVTRGVDVRLLGTAGPGIHTFQWGLGAGLRLHH